MEESERPKPPTRRRRTAGDDVADARATTESPVTAKDANVAATTAAPAAKPVRRRVVAAKVVGDPDASAPKPATPRRTTTRPTATGKPVADSATAMPVEKPTAVRRPRATPAPKTLATIATPTETRAQPKPNLEAAAAPQPQPPSASVSTTPQPSKAQPTAPGHVPSHVAKPPLAAQPTAPPKPAQPQTPTAPRKPVASSPVARASPTSNASPKPPTAPEALPSFLRPATPTRPMPTRTEARPADASQRSQRIVEWLVARLPPKHRARALNYLVLMRLDRPVGALLLLWPTWWALWFAANDFPPIGLLVIFTLGVFVMRSAGCVINDYADHEWLDAHVERTRGRPMAAGRVTRREALMLFASLLVLAFVLVLFTNALTIGLSFVGAALAAIYPFTKRVTHLAQVVLGAAFGWSIPMAFAAVTHSLPPLCWLLFLANVLFSTIYDTEYAMVDRDDDLRVGAMSTAILFGDADRAIVGVLMATFLFAMLLAGQRATLHWPYFMGLALAAAGFAWQQWTMRDRSRAHCFAAFRNNNWVGLALWVGLVLALAMR